MRHARRHAPYIRRRNRKDRPDGLRTAIRMEVFGSGCYVLVQRGSPHYVLEAASTRRELVLGLVPRASARHLRQWARRFRSLWS